MKKQKITLSVFTLIFLFVNMFFASNTQAAASAVVSWTPPTTDEGGGALTGLSGYKVYYNTVSTWLNVLGSCSEGLGTPVSVSVDVPGAGVSSYRFNNNLVAGETYYFTVAAYDNASTPNLSKCAVDSNQIKEVSKIVSYSGDINPTADRTVDINDFTLFADDYGKTSFCGPVNKADIDGDCTVGINDFTILADDYGKSF